MKSINAVDIQGFLEDIAGFHNLLELMDIFHKFLVKHGELDWKMTFSGAVRYANRMEE